MQTVKTIRGADTTAEFGASPEAIGAALYYEEKFVPTLFRPWVAPVIDAAGVGPGDRVLDVACGTGVVTRALAAVVGERPKAVGLDIAAGMLTVASRIDSTPEWRLGDAETLPFPEQSFDRVTCQFGLMFFADPVRAIGEMRRVLRPGGRLALSVWNSLEANRGFADKVEILQAVAGQAAADALRAPFCLGEADELADIARRAGLGEFELQDLAGEARFECIADFVDAELRGWLPVMGVDLDETTIAAIHDRCRRQMAGYGLDDGFVLPTSARILGADG